MYKLWVKVDLYATLLISYRYKGDRFMSKSLKVNCKKVLFSVLAATLSFGSITPANNIKAEAISTTTKSVKVKDTTLTVNAIKVDPATQKIVADVTFERQGGIPEDVQWISVEANATIKIDGKDYTLGFGGTDKLIRTSDTTVNGMVSIMPTIGQGKNTQVAKGLTGKKLSGKNIHLKVSRITYYKMFSDTTNEFKALINNVQSVKGVSVEKGGFSFLKGTVKSNILPEKGLNIPILENDSDHETVDNIGFVDGKLQIRINGYLCNIDFVDAAGKKAETAGGGTDGKKYLQIYDIKDKKALSKYTVKVTKDEKLMEDVQSPAVSLDLVI